MRQREGFPFGMCYVSICFSVQFSEISRIVISERVSSLICVSTDRVPRGGGARASKMGEEVKIQVYKEDSK